MKALWALIASCCSVTAYFVLVNPTGISWLPIPLIVLLLVFLYGHDMTALYTAIATGFLMDIHFLYIGPYILILTLIVLMLRQLKYSIFVHRGMISTIALSSIGIIVYFILLGGMTWWNSGVSVFSVGHLRLFTIALGATLVFMIVLHLCSAMIARITRKRHGWKSV